MAGATLLQDFDAVALMFAARSYTECVPLLESMMERIDDEGSNLKTPAFEKLFDGLSEMLSTDGAPFSVSFAAMNVVKQIAADDQTVFSTATAVRLVPLCLRLLVSALSGGSSDGLEWAVDNRDLDPAVDIVDELLRTLDSKMIPTLHATMDTAIATWGSSVSWSDKVAILLGSQSSTLDIEKHRQLLALGFGDAHPQVRAVALSAAVESRLRGFPVDTDALRRHVDLLLSMLDAEPPLDRPQTLLLRSALRSAGTCLSYLMINAPTDEENQIPLPALGDRLITVLTTGSLDTPTAAKAIELANYISVNAAKTAALLELALQTLADATKRESDLTPDDESIIEAALDCATNQACSIDAAVLGPCHDGICFFLCRYIDLMADGYSFMTELLRKWRGNILTNTGEEIMAEWAPRLSGKLIAGASLPSPQASASTTAPALGDDSGDSIADRVVSTVICKTVCLEFAFDFITGVPLSVLGDDFITRIVAAADTSLAFVIEPGEYGENDVPTMLTNVRQCAIDVITAVLIAERKDGATTTRYIPPSVVDHFFYALGAESDEDEELWDTMLRAGCSLLASLHHAVSVESARNAIQVLLAIMNAATDECSDRDSGATAIHIGHMLGYLHRATVPNECPDLAALFKQARDCFVGLFNAVALPASTFAFQAGMVAHGQLSDVLSHKPELLRHASAVLKRAIDGEAEDDVLEEVMRLCTALLDLTARAEGTFSLELKFVKSVVKACQTILDMEYAEHFATAAVRAAIALAEWMTRNNAPEAAKAAVAMCAKHLRVQAHWVYVVESSEATAIVDRLAQWTADPELCALYCAFPMTRDVVIDAIEGSEFLSPVGAAALQEARTMEAPEAPIPARKRRR